jgi:hypothetical protein
MHCTRVAGRRFEGEHGVPGYLDLHFALLHPSTPPDLATHHLQAANAMLADSEPAP